MTHEGQGSTIPEPPGGRPRFIFKLRHGGLRWILLRLHSELVLPTTKPGKRLHAAIRNTLSFCFAPARWVRNNFSQQSLYNKDILYAFYDLKVEPITFDFLWFLTGADIERRRLGLGQIQIVIVPGQVQGLRNEDPQYEVAVPQEARHWRIHNILLSAITLLPSCAGVTLAGSRIVASNIRSQAGSNIYPHVYETVLPSAHHPNDSLLPAKAGTRPIGILRATSQGLQYIDQWMTNHSQGRRLLTITIRDYSYGSGRNSNIPAWGDFVRQLDQSIWWPVFVLDTERTLYNTPVPIQEFTLFKEVSWNLGLRMSLYQRAWLNLGVNNGPMALCWLNDLTRYLTFKIVTPSVSQTTLAFNLSRGFESYQSLPFASPFQKWIWEEDDLPIICREFESMVQSIEHGYGQNQNAPCSIPS